jgi:hypothetical protein
MMDGVKGLSYLLIRAACPRHLWLFKSKSQCAKFTMALMELSPKNSTTPVVKCFVNKPQLMLYAASEISARNTQWRT